MRSAVRVDLLDLDIAVNNVNDDNPSCLPPPSKTPMTPRPPIVTSGPSPLSTNNLAQLYAILAETLQKNKNLERELAIARRNAEKNENIVGLTQKSPQNST